ncbi:MAG TPA: glycoside hydrolase family 2 TIM barrel-domain containing protein [Bacteroidota bacterium]|nr:glycoside hydrolase family 2 TIM barrel-domain containing protein [Bacteroidota bacterium]
MSQVTVYENGQPIQRGSDVGLHPDTPTRKKIDLNGEWSYSFDRQNWSAVKVPSAFNYEGEIVFLRKFSVDEETLTQRALKFVALGINYEAEVLVNDQFIGRHVGGYTSFEFEIPETALRLGSENVIQIIVRNELGTRSTLPVRKQIWGWRNYGGIYRDVYLLSTPRTWIDGLNIRTDVASDFRQASVRVLATVTSGKGEAAQPAEEKTYSVQVELFDKITNALVAQSQAIPVTVGQNRVVEVQSSLSVANAKLWSPETPELYRLKVSLVEGTGAQRRSVDEVERTIGFSKVSLENRTILLNGKKTVLRGVVWHEDSPTYGSALTYEQMEKDIALIKTLGANAVRFAFHPPHPYMLNLCSRYGLLALEEIPVWNVPAAILAEDHVHVLAETAVREMIQRDRHQVSVLAWGVGSEFDTSDLRARKFVETMTATMRSLDHRPTYLGTRMIANDICVSLVDFAALTPPSGDEKQFRDILQQWRDRYEELPAVVLRYGREVEHGNRKGYSDPLSEEAQARFFELRYRIIKELNYAGSFVESFADWRGDRPIMTVNLGDPYIHPVGLVSAAREKRLAYEVVRSLYNEEKLSSLPIGSYRASFPAAPLVFGLTVIFVLAYFLHYNRRFAECFGRSLLRPYNFFADLRDLHAVASGHTLLLSVTISMTLAVVVASFLYQFRTYTEVDFALTQFFVSDWAKQQLIIAAWNLFTGIGVFTIVFFLLLVVVTVLVKLFATIARTKIFWYHAYSITVWGALPLVFLIFPGMLLLKLLETPAYIVPLLVLIALFVLWALFRVLKGVSVIYDVSPLKAYTGGILFCVLCLAGVGFYYDAAYALSAYIEFFIHITKSLG